jgi:hypothetical protein
VEYAIVLERGYKGKDMQAGTIECGDAILFEGLNDESVGQVT